MQLPLPLLYLREKGKKLENCKNLHSILVAYDKKTAHKWEEGDFEEKKMKEFTWFCMCFNRLKRSHFSPYANCTSVSTIRSFSLLPPIEKKEIRVDTRIDFDHVPRFDAHLFRLLFFCPKETKTEKRLLAYTTSGYRLS